LLLGDWLCKWSPGREKKTASCIVCFAYSVVVVAIAAAAAAVVVLSFVVLLNCLYLNPRVLPGVHSPPLPTVEGKGMCELAAVWCLIVGCRVKPQHCQINFIIQKEEVGHILPCRGLLPSARTEISALCSIV